jgi:hypothetical protein
VPHDASLPAAAFPAMSERGNSIDRLLAQAREEAARAFVDDHAGAVQPSPLSPPPPTVLFAAASASAAGLVPCPHQAGGHHHQFDDGSGLSATMVDASGRFYKLLPEDKEDDEEEQQGGGVVGGGRGSSRSNAGRARREVQWYERCASRFAAAVESESAFRPLAHLYTAYMPRYHGIARVAGRWLLALEDVASPEAAEVEARQLARTRVMGIAELPKTSTTARITAHSSCVLDVKLGKTTAYPWAPPALRSKCEQKDAATTQAALGFRLCGVVCRRQGATTTSATTTWSEDRHWGKALAGMGEVLRAFRRFGALGVAGAAATDAASTRLVLLAAEVARLREFLENLPHARLLSASVLLLLDEDDEVDGGEEEEGEAEAAAVAAAERGGSERSRSVRVKLVDFAHTFWRDEEEGPDTNLLAGLDALKDALNLAAACGSF